MKPEIILHWTLHVTYMIFLLRLYRNEIRDTPSTYLYGNFVRNVQKSFILKLISSVTLVTQNSYSISFQNYLGQLLPTNYTFCNHIFIVINCNKLKSIKKHCTLIRKQYLTVSLDFDCLYIKWLLYAIVARIS